MEDVFIGEMKLVAFNYDPVGFLPCDGKELPISQYQPLFALIGCTFGGDGRTTFALPNYPGPAKGMHWIIAYEGIWPSRP